VKEEDLKPMMDAWRKGDVVEAKRLVPEGAVEALAVCGTPDQALDKISRYAHSGVTLPILLPIGNLDFAMTELAPRTLGG
jgi:alkanesulfonate monooxygenase SsuD/methylene tetrahydromethanopterin reductase-like flavin-dependent oxidoreductase (luciferase family)